MPKGQYTRGRLILLQLIMWVIFGLCMGMAAFVTSKHRSTYRVDLSDPVPLGAVTVRFPKKWKTVATVRGTLSSADANEGKIREAGRVPRRLTVFVEKLDEAVFPQVYLRSRPVVGYQQRPGILSYFWKDNEQGRPEHEFEAYPMIGTSGVQAGKLDSEGTLRVFACAVVPDPADPAVFWAVTVRLICDESFSPGDRAAFRQVTDSISFTKN